MPALTMTPDIPRPVMINPTVVDAVTTPLPHIDIQRLQMLRQTSPAADTAASKLLTQRLLANLQPFVDDPQWFRCIMRKTGCIVSGSVALNILDIDRSHLWSPTDLDIYAPAGGAQDMVQYLCAAENYNLLPAHESKYHYDDEHVGFRRVYQLRRETTDIDVIESLTESPLHPLPYFWSTHVMNFLTADSFCVAYPDYTLTGRGLLNPMQLIAYQYPRPRTLTVLSKYLDRSYDFRLRPTAWAANITSECAHESACPHTIRHFADSLCLVGSFHTGVPDDFFTGDTALTIRWIRGGCSCANDADRFRDAITPVCETIRLEETLSISPMQLSD